MVAQRVTDIITLLDFASSYGLPISVQATGLLTVPALHAKVLDSRINQLYLYNSIHSYKDILQHPLAPNWYSYVVPGVLQFYDIPDLINLANPETIHIKQIK
jgi:hypothetical protein